VRNNHLRWLLIGTMIIGSSAAAQQAAPSSNSSKPSQTPNEPVKKPPVGVKPALTTAECAGLGGTASANVGCPGDACYTTNKDGVVHWACIDEVKH
jgi:hypothetical protein